MRGRLGAPAGKPPPGAEPRRDTQASPLPPPGRTHVLGGVPRARGGFVVGGPVSPGGHPRGRRGGPVGRWPGAGFPRGRVPPHTPRLYPREPATAITLQCSLLPRHVPPV